jgi:hypothetical protein
MLSRHHLSWISVHLSNRGSRASLWAGRAWTLFVCWGQRMVFVGKKVESVVPSRPPCPTPLVAAASARFCRHEEGTKLRLLCKHRFLGEASCAACCLLRCDPCVSGGRGGRGGGRSKAASFSSAVQNLRLFGVRVFIFACARLGLLAGWLAGWMDGLCAGRWWPFPSQPGFMCRSRA